MSELDAFERFLVNRTEKAVEYGFLWIKVLKLLKRRSHKYIEVQRSLNPRPHLATLHATLLMMQKMGLVKRLKEGHNSVYSITEKGEKVLGRAVNHLRTQIRMILDVS